MEINSRDLDNFITGHYGEDDPAVRADREEEERDEYMEQFSILCGRLSPENLSCDGELSRTEVNARYRSIMREWKALESKYCVKVTEDEVFKWDMAKYNAERAN